MHEQMLICKFFTRMYQFWITTIYSCNLAFFLECKTCTQVYNFCVDNIAPYQNEEIWDLVPYHTFCHYGTLFANQELFSCHTRLHNQAIIILVGKEVQEKQFFDHYTNCRPRVVQ